MAELTKEQMEQNVKFSGKLIQAVECCTFHGRDAENVATLIGFLKNEQAKAKRELDAALEADSKKFQATFGKVPA